MLRQIGKRVAGALASLLGALTTTVFPGGPLQVLVGGTLACAAILRHSARLTAAATWAPIASTQMRVARRLAGAWPEVHVASLGYADYGEALRAGLLASTGDAAVIFDVDYYDLEFAAAALGTLDRAPTPTGPVVVVGSKRAPGSQDERTVLRRLATATFSTILRRLFGLSLSDTHGMKVVSLAALRPVVAECRCGADLFDTELIIRAERAGFRVAEIPVVVRELRPSRTSILRRVPRTVGGIIRLRRVLGRPPKR
jgi:hypothetical protein